MSNSVLEGILKDKDFNFKKLLFKIVKDYSLTLDELLLLIFFLNQDKPVLNPKIISDVTFMNEKNILEAFTSLTSKGLISMKISKQNDGKVNDNLFVPNEGAQVKVVDVGNTYIHQSYLEGSNIDTAQEMTDMIVTQRAFQLSSKSLQTADEMWGMINNMRS